jgi:serine/threonine-protein kinase
VFQIVSRPLGPGAEAVLLERDFTTVATAISPDGRWLLFAEFRSGQSELLALDLEAGGEPRQLTSTAEFSEYRGSLSPDGRWLVYQSNESGRNEIYVQPFPGPGRRWQVSTAGGFHPLWSPDGRYLYYRDDDQSFVRVAVQAGATFDAQLPEPLFPLLLPSGVSVRRIAVSPDGQRFVASVPGGDGGEAATSVVVGWRGALER